MPFNSWVRLSLDAWRLTADSAHVMGLRTLKIATGGADAQAEAALMVNEKIQAAVDLQTLALTGALGSNAPDAASATIRHYRRRVSANRRRLLKG